MPILAENVQITYKLLPLTLFPDGSASVSIRRGLQHENGNWEPLTEEAYQMAPDVVSSVLDAPPAPGLTRRDDLSFAVYMYLVSIGKITGQVA